MTQLIREQLQVLHQLVGRYEVDRTQPVPRRRTFRTPEDVADYLLMEMRDLAQEQVRTVLVDVHNRLINTQLVAQGSGNTALVSLADVFREAVRCGATALILAHNHPSGQPEPSPADVHLTKQAAKAGRLLGIEVLDHIIVGEAGWTSLRLSGLYRPRKSTSR